MVGGAPLALRELTLDAVIAILVWGRWCDEETAVYRAPQVLEVLRDPNFSKAGKILVFVKEGSGIY